MQTSWKYLQNIWQTLFPNHRAQRQTNLRDYLLLPGMTSLDLEEVFGHGLEGPLRVVSCYEGSLLLAGLQYLA